MKTRAGDSNKNKPSTQPWKSDVRSAQKSQDKSARRQPKDFEAFLKEKLSPLTKRGDNGAFFTVLCF